MEILQSEIASISQAIDSEKEIRQVALIAANDSSEIADLIVTAFQKVGKDGNVLVDESEGFNSSVEIKGDMRIKQGLKDEATESLDLERSIELDNSYILLTDEELSDFAQITNIIQKVNSTNTSLVIIAKNFNQRIPRRLCLGVKRKV